jgi:glycosyltransferase involved in cell wall biosynthesis
MKVLIIAGYTPSLINFRGDLIRAMVAEGHKVMAAGPEGGYEDQIAELGAEFLQIPFSRTGSNPFKDLILINRLRRIMAIEKPDIVFGYTIKPVIYGSIAARLAGVKNIYSMVTGLGYVFLAKGIKSFVIRNITKQLYSMAFKSCKKVLFQNPDDLNEFVQLGLIHDKKCVLVHGSGVNLDRFTPSPLPQTPVFLMICRILKDKGVMEYLEAAKQVKKIYPEARFQLLGPFDTNPTALKYEDIGTYVDDGSIEYLGETKDVRPFISNASVYVLPSYREGTPRTVLEAMAMKRPIITTDAPGCRETVIDGRNGFLVPIKDVDALAQKMIWMIENKDLTQQMAENSLRFCRDKYDVNKVNTVVMKTIGLL